jgi:hypothetical protein
VVEDLVEVDAEVLVVDLHVVPVENVFVQIVATGFLIN